MSACEYIFRFNMNTSTTTEVDGVTTVRMGTELHERIVRCRDCRHADEIMTRYAGLQYACMKFDDATVEPDGFCAWAERRNE